jgi:integrase
LSLLYKRPNSPYWYVTKLRVSTKTSNRKRAEEFARKALEAYWREEALGEHIKTWRDLVPAWLDSKAHKRSLARDEFIISDATQWFRNRLSIDNSGALRLVDITAELVRDYGAFVKARASASTANRHLATLRALLRMAHRYDWITKCPPIELYPVTKDAPRWLNHEEFDRVAAHLPEVARDMATIALQTGMRFSNVAGLRWDWISADGAVAVVPATVTKTARTYTIPLSTKARAVIERRRQALPREAQYVFPRDDEDAPYASIRYWWDKACKRSGIDCRFHDLRHSWASLHMKNGTPDRVIQEMGGWSSPAMLQNYAHLSTAHLTRYADNLNSCAESALGAAEPKREADLNVPEALEQ